MPMPPMTPQQIQYQQAMLASAARQTPFYPMGGFPNTPQSMDSFRNVGGQGMSPSPVMPHSGYAAPGFSPMMSQPMYPYPMQYGMPQQAQHSGGGGGGGRRGR
ncbi:MAG: hypothetical protein Q9169_008696, partial [Polycauliona sp. 2 TL-2023]